MSMNELNSAARDLMSVRAMIAELEAEAEALTDKLKAAMTERGEETLTGDGWKASRKNVSSTRFDSKSFKTDHADLYAQYSINQMGPNEQCVFIKQEAASGIVLFPAAGV